MPVLTGGNVLGGEKSGGVYTNAGAPVNNTTLVGVAGVGDLLSDTTNGKLYICTATNGSSTITWTVVGTQS